MMKNYLKYSLAFLAIVMIGVATYFLVNKFIISDSNQNGNDVYTCSMHPEIIRYEPGSCPICGMNLIKKVTNDNELDSGIIENLLRPTDKFIVGNYQTTTAIDSVISSEINIPGIVEYDQNSSVNIAARIDGRIEKMYVHYKFQKVTKGQKLFDLYSPELLTEQQNYVYLISNDSENKSLIAASKQKLLYYGMSNPQIDLLTTSKRTNPVTSILSTANGIIQGTNAMTEIKSENMQSTNTSSEILSIKEGDYIKKNTSVFSLLNTEKIWAVFNVLQGQTSLIKLNQPIKITTELSSSEKINAKINFIETQFNPNENSNRIRVYLNNTKLKLPIGLRLQGDVKINPIHSVWLHRETIVSIGEKKIVFVKSNNGYKTKVINTGIELNDFIQILEGLTVSDTIAANAQFLIDSESFINTSNLK